MDSVEKIIFLVRSIVTGDNPVAVVLGLLCVYLGYQMRLARKQIREDEAKNEQLHERIEKYLELGWRAQVAQGQGRAEPLREDPAGKKNPE